jgi:hypothetical protein
MNARAFATRMGLSSRTIDRVAHGIRLGRFVGQAMAGGLNAMRAVGVAEVAQLKITSVESITIAVETMMAASRHVIDRGVKGLHATLDAYERGVSCEYTRLAEPLAAELAIGEELAAERRQNK